MSDFEDDLVTSSGATSRPKKSKAKTAGHRDDIEGKYTKLTAHEHILKRPDTYIGSIEHTEMEMWVWDTDLEKMVLRNVKFVPGLYKIFDEILVNAADNKQNDPKNCNLIKIDIDVENNRISCWNNGQGIPVTEHKDFDNMWVPEMIFGHLLTSSNYDDDKDKVTGGRNGYGAKLCNIYSTKFTVETSSKQYKKKFKMVWQNNMYKKGTAKVSPTEGSDFTKITFEPDLQKLGKMTHLDKDTVSVLTRRAYDLAATSGCKVFLNGVRLSVKSFKEYSELFLKDALDNAGNQVVPIHQKVNDHWEIAIAVSDSGYKHMSFCNNIATIKGGKHLDYVTNQITKKIKDKVSAKCKGTKITDFYIKNHSFFTFLGRCTSKHYRHVQLVAFYDPKGRG